MFKLFCQRKTNANLGHLRVAHVLVDENSLDEFRVGQLAAGLRFDFDQLEVHVLPLEVRNAHNSPDRHLSELTVTLVHALNVCIVNINKCYVDTSENTSV